jgi:hypothetical protein
MLGQIDATPLGRMRAHAHLNDAPSTPDDEVHQQRNILLWQIELTERVIERCVAATKRSQETLNWRCGGVPYDQSPIRHTIAPRGA